MLKKWDGQHIVIAFAFLVGLGAAIGAACSTLPAGMTEQQKALLLAPAFMLAFSHVFAFFKNPPANPDQAFKQGENATKAGFARVGLVFALGIICAAAMVANAHGRRSFAVQGQGCNWWAKNQPVVVEDINKDAQCVLGAILGGAASPAAVVSQCVSLTESQVLSISASLFNYYVLGQTDAGLSGAALPPFRGIPSALDGSDLGKLRAFVGD